MNLISICSSYLLILGDSWAGYANAPAINHFLKGAKMYQTESRPVVGLPEKG